MVMESFELETKIHSRNQRSWKIYVAFIGLAVIVTFVVVRWRFLVNHECSGTLGTLASMLNVKLTRATDGGLLVLGSGFYGKVYAASGHQALKVTRGREGHETAIAESLPKTSTLLPVTEHASAWIGNWVTGRYQCTGVLMPKLEGLDGSKWRGRIPSHQLLSLAADVSVPLNALHTKIRGYVVLHCDLHPGNILVSDEGRHAVVIDYEYMNVHQLAQGEPSSGKFFGAAKHFCFGTDWQAFPKQVASDFQKIRGAQVGPYSSNSDWRNLGMLLYSMSVGAPFGVHPMVGVHPNSGHSVFAGHHETCNYRCAAERNIRTNLDGPLRHLVMFLILEHDSIQNEETQVLRHKSFSELADSPADMAANIVPSGATSDFKAMFGSRVVV